ncbi:multidrug efflux SMR transporter [Exiguobacterium sp. SL-9]|uniref:DMT family transporter n=1 Tax=Exiguobacterium sp. SL-9 TaxID=2510963 RepID=UPI001038818A|nr:multidrug efflux SMR transporter [Exiguobacterium sp. SL-9]TCI22546.1 multidrug efflux SMR transporter [Exiguobacterium sp. SL-9]
MKGYLLLLVSISFEVLGTSMLKLSDGFTNLWPSVILLVSFAVSFTLMGFVLKTIPLSIAYSVWAGLGTVATGLIGVFVYGEVLSTVNSIGLIVIVLGVIVMNVGKTNTVHG